MFIKPQRLDYKISPLDLKYSRKIEQNLAASNETFSDLETPGWSSLMKSQISDKTKSGNNDKDQKQDKGDVVKENSIYNKLNRQNSLKWSTEDQKKMIKTKLNSQQCQLQQLLQPNTGKQLKIVPNPKLPTPDQNSSLSKRWNQITIHQYLYQNSIKQQNKKMITRILDEEYKKKQILKFTPEINKKSIILAESKFLKIKNQEKQGKIGEEGDTLVNQKQKDRDKEDKDVVRYRTLNKIFYFLTENKSVLTESELQNTLERLPLPCITVIQPIIQQIYRGKPMEWLDFLQNFNASKVKGKEGFFALISKWLTRQETKEQNQQ